MDFVFDRTAEGRVIKNLTVVDDATHEAVAIVPERTIGGRALTRILDHLALQRGLPSAIRTDNGKEFCGHAMLSWAHLHGVALFLIEPGKPNQNAYIESFNGRLVAMSCICKAMPPTNGCAYLNSPINRQQIAY